MALSGLNGSPVMPAAQRMRPPVGVVAVHRGLDQRRIGDGAGDDLGRPLGFGGLDGDGDDLGGAFAVGGDLVRQGPADFAKAAANALVARGVLMRASLAPEARMQAVSLVLAWSSTVTALKLASAACANSRRSRGAPIFASVVR